MIGILQNLATCLFNCLFSLSKLLSHHRLMCNIRKEPTTETPKKTVKMGVVIVRLYQTTQL